jgi:hypothetical protein
MPPTRREPPPRVAPRRVAGQPTGGPPEARRAKAMLYVAAALGIVGLGIAFWLSSRAEPVDPAAAADARVALEAAGCTLTLTAAPRNASDHSDVASPDDVVDAWTSDPPTAGPHYGETAVYGAYTEPLQQARVVHNLEHGAVAIQYGPGAAATTVAELTAFYDRNRNGTLLAPYEPLGSEIALGAWIAEGGDRGQGVLARCPDFDDEAFQAFLTAYQFKGPERFSPAAMVPGSS